MTTSSFKQIQVQFAKRDIEELYARLQNTRWPEIPFDTGWSTGTNERVLRDLVQYWLDEYDWFEAEERLNRLAHHSGPVGGEEMHFVFYRGVRPRQPFPLLLLHGWPGSFLDFSKAAPLLSTSSERQPGFDLIVPSLPGFVLSDAPRAPGMNPTRIAERLHLLMHKLGYKRYGVQGGDWGGLIARELGRLYPEEVIGVHLNIAPWMIMPTDRELTEEEKDYLAYREKFDAAETAYWAIQGTKPQTLCVGLQDSPAGFMAWILEKFWAWSDHGEDLWHTFDRQDVLNTAMLYWLNGRVLSAARIYHEAIAWWPGDLSRVEVPTAYARFPKEPWRSPRSLIDPLFNIVRYTEMPWGGHFAALEQPELFAEDVAGFFSGLSSKF